MEQVYSDHFIFNCANLYKVFSNETYQLVRNLIESRNLHIGVFKSDSIFDFLDKLGKGNEAERFTRKQILDWFAGNRLSQLSFKNVDLNTVPTTSFSSVWVESDEIEDSIWQAIDKKGLLSIVESEFDTNTYSWLFKTKNLPTITLNTEFNWNEYLEGIAHFTKKIYVFDRYFYYNWNVEISELVGSFLERNPNLQIEIIGELDKNSNSYSYAVEALERMFDEFPTQLKAHKIDPKIAKNYHDRYLMTDFCLLKSEIGFPPNPERDRKPYKQTTPTLIGRYSEDNEKWKEEYSTWEEKTKTICRLIDVEELG